jgi:hypothetical protein
MKNWWWKVLSFEKQNAAVLSITFERQDGQPLVLRQLVREIGLAYYKQLPLEAVAQRADAADKDFCLDLNSYARHFFFTGKSNDSSFTAIDVSDTSFFLMDYGTWLINEDDIRPDPVTQLLAALIQDYKLKVIEWKLLTGYFQDYPVYQQVVGEGNHQALIDYLDL